MICYENIVDVAFLIIILCIICVFKYIYMCEIMSERDFIYPKIKDMLLSQDLHVAFLLYS